MELKIENLKWETFEGRRTEYEKLENVFNNMVDEWIKNERLSPEDRKHYVRNNFFRKIVEHITHIVCAERPNVVVANESLQEYVDKVLFESKFFDNLNGAVKLSQVLSHIIIRVKKVDHLNHSVIEFVHPNKYDVEFDEWDATVPKKQSLIFERQIDNRFYRRKEEEWFDNDKKKFFWTQVDEMKDGNGEWVSQNKPAPLIHDFGFLIHVVRLDVMPGRFWGRPIFYDLEDNLREINNLVSQMVNVLRKHANPKLVMPSSMFDALVNKNKKLLKQNLIGEQYIEVGQLEIYRYDPNMDNAAKPEYVVWDAKLDSGFKLYNLLLDNLSKLGDVPVEVLRTQEGYGNLSGTAMLLSKTPSYNRAKEIATAFKQTVEKALYQCQQLDKMDGKLKQEPEFVTVTFDHTSSISTDEIKLEMEKYKEGLQSWEETAQRINNWNSRQLEIERKRIQEEKANKQVSQEGTSV
ncbi:phage portal protein [Paenibacillus contaminans]|uniref:Phage portal protein n=1 Tax=Paenibacillus contaminans TaxID=450362 RepID=A0A329MT25_9BACL|nr:phage portal protein [Paenibacillus contaminans]RAV22670.1 hypothetical protein DQG23_00165 [Paenibacillus contaminans]